MAVTLLTPIGAVSTGCLGCPPKPARMNLNRNYHPGFGFVRLTRDGTSVIFDPQGDLSYGRRFEKWAAADPDHDWRVEIHGPMGGVVYQRHGLKQWFAVARLEGFA